MAGVAEKRRQFEELARKHDGVMLRAAIRMCGGDRDRAEDSEGHRPGVGRS